MNLDELKALWTIYDRKLAATQKIQEKVIVSMITTRSSSQFSIVRRTHILSMAWMLLCLTLGILIITTNPFDYSRSIEYVPLTLFSTCIFVLMVGTASAYIRLRTIAIEQHSVEASLKAIINEYEKPRKFLNYTLVAFLFSGVVLFPLSFLPRKVDTLGLGMAIAESLIPISIASLLVFVAYKLGAFKERHPEKFRQYLYELTQLRSALMELAAE